MTPMSLEAIEMARRFALDNAKSLVEEAKLLRDNRRYARSVSLAILAAEEFAKLPMLARAAFCTTRNIPFDWKRLDQRLRSHSSKLNLLMTFSMLLGAVPEDPAEAVEFVRRLSEKNAAATTRNNVKMDGFYVGVQNGVPYSPAAIFDKTIADKHIEDAESLESFFEHVETNTAGRMAELVGALDSFASPEPVDN